MAYEMTTVCSKQTIRLKPNAEDVGDDDFFVRLSVIRTLAHWMLVKAKAYGFGFLVIDV